MPSGVFRISVVVCAAALLFASAASGASILTPYNVILSGNMSNTCCDMEGGMAVGGTASIPGSWNIANGLNGEPVSAFPSGTGNGSPVITQGTTLVVAGGITSGSANLANGNYYVSSGTVSSSNGQEDTSDPLNFTTLFTNYKALSTQISKLTANTADSANLSNNVLYIYVNNAGLNVIDLTQAQLQGADEIEFVAGSGVTFATSTSNYGNAWVELNVPGTAVTYSTSYGWGTYFCTSSGSCAQQVGDNAYGAEDVLYNFYQATSITLTSGAIVGSFLAPNAAVSDTSGNQFDGSLVAASFSGSTEFHNLNFLGPTFTPEPAPFAVVGLGLLGLAYVRKRRRA